MPIYEIRHICPLTPHQQDTLARRITAIHTTHYTAPTFLVNVRFHNETANNAVYIGGMRRQGNHIRGVIRAGPSRTRQDHESVIREIVESWDRIVGEGEGKGERVLWSCVLVGGIAAGYEGGFLTAPAGEDREWMREHWEEFEEKARGGDEVFGEFVRDVKERGLVEVKG